MNDIDEINSLEWADWSLGGIDVDADDAERVSIELICCSDSAPKENLGASISCENFIGFSSTGSRDEGLIEDIRIDEEGDIINDSLKRIKHLYDQSPSSFQLLWSCGDAKIINGKWHQLNIKLASGSEIKIACGRIRFETH